MSDRDDIADLLHRGFRLLQYDRLTKGPSGAAAVDWPTRSELFITSADQFDPERNVGALLGVEIEPGKFIGAVDIDWADGLPLVKRLLPPTELGHGRDSKIISQAWYTSEEPSPSIMYNDLEGAALLEWRCAKRDGSLGLQSMIPPSLHPDNERVVWRSIGPIAHVPTITRHVTLCAVAFLLFKHIGQRGLVHNTRLALAGFLLMSGLTEEETTRVAEALASATGNNVGDAATSVRSTASRLRVGERVHGRGQLASLIGDDGRRVCTRIREWLGEQDFAADEEGRIYAKNQDNVRLAFKKLDVELRYNAFTHTPMVSYGEGPAQPVSDSIVNQIWFDIDTNFHFQPPTEFFENLVNDTAFRNQYHPVKDYLGTLTWDGTPRVNRWLTTYGGAADNAYTQAVGSLVLIAAVKRVMQPGCKFDELLVLESEQGTFKSSALEALCPERDWFSDNLELDKDTKQLIEATGGKWIVEVAELSGLSSGKVEHLKATLSRQVDGPVRMAYGHYAVQIPRQFVPIGTTNDHAYLLDATGNRRFWPVRVFKFDVPMLIRDRDQLWAEAAYREAHGESIRMDPSLYEVARFQQDRRRAEDPWLSIVRARFPENGPAEPPRAGTSVIHPRGRYRVPGEIVWATLGIPVANRDNAGQRRVGRVMQTLGFRKCSIRDGKTVHNGWARDPENPEPVQQGLHHDHDEEEVME